jgi:hypothetical protein
MFPPAIIYINGNTDGYGNVYGDLDGYGKATLESQLYIHETMTGDEFDARVSSDPNYPQIVHLMGYRILVIRADLRNYTNREFADVVLFVKQGMASIEKNNFGTPGLTLPIERIEIHQLLRYNTSQYVVNLPQPYQYPFGPTLGGIFAIQSRDTSGVHDANPDNEYNNTEFINRK